MRSKSLKIAVITFSALFLCFAYLVYKEQARPFKEIPKTVGNFVALATDGSKTEYYFERGDVTLIVLSASWCPACIAELPTLKKLHQEFSPRGFKILMVSEDDNLKGAARFKKKFDMPWNVIHWNYELINALGNPNAIPVSYLVDGNDEITAITAGIIDEQEMRSKIEGLLK